MDARAYLESLIHFGQKFGLETMHAIGAALGHPERASPSLLIAGTNGKGSVAAYLDQGLRSAGLRVGRYTSPHLVRVNERIAVDGQNVSDAALEVALAAVRTEVDALLAAGILAAPATYFEALTAAAFVHFRTERVDVAVLEVGMGARLDATNVADPLVSAIVSIDFDHQAYLGTTLAEIAREKAGVLRAGRTTVLGPLPAEAREAIEAEAARVGAILDTAAEGVRWPLEPALAGAHQRDNLQVALRVLESAAVAGLAFDLERAVQGLERTEWPGRLQWIAGPTPLLLDGAHNAAGARALAAYLRERGEPFVLLFGAMRDKAFVEMAEILFPLAREVIATQPAIARAATAAEIAEATRHLGVACRAEAEVGAALRLAVDRAGGVSPVVVAGSLFLVGAVLERLAGSTDA